MQGGHDEEGAEPLIRVGRTRSLQTLWQAESIRTFSGLHQWTNTGEWYDQTSILEKLET